MGTCHCGKDTQDSRTSYTHKGGQLKIRLSACSAFSLSSVVRSHGWSELTPFGICSDGLEYVDRLDSGRVVVLLIAQYRNGVTVEVSDCLDDLEREEVARKVGWMVGLNQDLSAFYSVIRNEPRLANVEERSQGRVLRCPTLFEDAVKTILTTNTNWRGTMHMVDALVAGFGDPLPSDTKRHAFPAPERIGGLDPEELRTVARLGYRAPHVVELARAVATGGLKLESFKDTEMTTHELRKCLLAIKGVGPYAAANLLMIIGRYDFVPVDSWAVRLVSREWYQGEPVGKAEVEAAFARWGKWQGLCYWLWDWAHRKGV